MSSKPGRAIQSTGSVSVSTARVKCRVFVDFDGTIASADTTDLLLERFAAPAWRDIEEDWKAGRIGSRECMVRQIDLVRATPAEMDAFIRSVEIDKGFPSFVRLLRRLGHALVIASDGLDRTIRTVLDRNDIDVPYFANHLQWRGGDRWRLTFPHARSDCASLSGNCKCGFAEGRPRELNILVGDGRSDFCMAERADLVLAKSSLLAHCRTTGLPHIAFDNFDEATMLLAGWLEQRGAIPMHRSTRAADSK
jgi:2-hydroxy-3-keto-5-methylthiopentenyl-1-phosphate phosphatase